MLQKSNLESFDDFSNIYRLQLWEASYFLLCTLNTCTVWFKSSLMLNSPNSTTYPMVNCICTQNRWKDFKIKVVPVPLDLRKNFLVEKCVCWIEWKGQGDSLALSWMVWTSAEEQQRRKRRREEEGRERGMAGMARKSQWEKRGGAVESNSAGLWRSEAGTEKSESRLGRGHFSGRGWLEERRRFPSGKRKKDFFSLSPSLSCFLK